MSVINQIGEYLMRIYRLITIIHTKLHRHCPFNNTLKTHFPLNILLNLYDI